MKTSHIIFTCMILIPTVIIILMISFSDSCVGLSGKYLKQCENNLYDYDIQMLVFTIVVESIFVVGYARLPSEELESNLTLNNISEQPNRRPPF